MPAKSLGKYYGGAKPLSPREEAEVRRIFKMDPPAEQVPEPKAKPADHNERTKKLLHDLGYHVYRVDRWNSFAQKANDLLGFGDMLALKAGLPPMIVQLTSKANMRARVKKILDLKSAKYWAETGGTIVVIGWEKHVSTGGAINYAHTIEKVRP